jgi:hypothetical protein
MEQETDHNELTSPPGEVQPEKEGIITTRTRRRQEQLDQLKDPRPSPPGPIRGGEIDDRNDQAYREQWESEHPGEEAPRS